MYLAHTITICETLKARINGIIDSGLVPLVKHDGFGNDIVKDSGAKYLHHRFKGQIWIVK
jgi:hypothetical protein